MGSETEKLRAYFLGELGIKEAEEIEERLFYDAVFEEEVVAAENDLIEDHLDGELSVDENRLFAASYLSTPERRKHVEIVDALRDYSRRHTRSSGPSVAESKYGFIDRLKAAFSGVPATAYAGCLILVILAGAGYFWLGGDGQSVGSQAEFAALNSADFNDLGSYAELPLITILPGSLRGAGASVKASETSASDKVFIRLSLPIEFTDYTDFNIRLSRETRELFVFEHLRPYKTNGGKELRFLLPGTAFNRGEYRFEVAPTQAAGTPMTYSLTID